MADGNNDESKMTKEEFQKLRSRRPTSMMGWDDIEFINDDEMIGSQKLQAELMTKYNLFNVPPFEMARYYIGSKNRLKKALQKYKDTMNLYSNYKLNSLTDDQMIKCFTEC